MENGNNGGRKRKIMLRLCVTEEERDLIHLKMEQYRTNNFGAYARKMLIDGYVIYVDYSDLKAVAAQMQGIDNNIRRIAKQVNSTTRIYERDFDEMKNGIADIWKLLRSAFDLDKTCHKRWSTEKKQKTEL